MKKGELRKDEIIAINAKLEADNSRLERRDQEVRKNLTALLKETPQDDYRFRNNIIHEREDRIMSWLDITFHIGRLKTDSAFADMQRRSDTDQGHIKHLQDVISELKKKYGDQT